MNWTWKRVTLAAIIPLTILYYFSLPNPLFSDSYSTVLLDKSDRLLGSTLASDGQWRFPESGPVPEKFRKALLVYEDKRFYYHPGIDPISLGRAIYSNLKAGKVVSGGSTLSMQVIRLSRRGKSRTMWEKLIEGILATRLELKYSKEEILSLYASHAPFGGNVVGIDAACWRYFGRNAVDLDWSEAALLAVLPNNPAMVHPGRNREPLKTKRNALLDRLTSLGYIDSLSAALAKAEDIPDKPLPLPRDARHLLERAIRDGKQKAVIRSTIDGNLQTRVTQILSDQYERLKTNGINNGAILVLDVRTGHVLAYVGNTNAGSIHHDEVDMISAKRSTGSILKPILFAAMINEGKLLQHSLLPDIPIQFGSFAPKNFSHQLDGAVPADRALIRSLNIPFVWALKEYRYEKFHQLLKNVGLTSLNSAPDRYGLTLVVGGAEGTLWDITGTYASMARTLNSYFERPAPNHYDRADFHAPGYMPGDSIAANSEANSWLDAASIWITFNALKELYRPGEETGWRNFSSSKNIAWKTGTSFGFRDAWAVGVNADYAVGVWAGNADGEGRPGLVGTEAAAPILFDVFAQLPGHAWFEQPFGDMDPVLICPASGQRVSSLCPVGDTLWVAHAGLQTPACAYHKTVHLSKDHKYRVHSACYPIGEMTTESWFVLPPIMDYYFRAKNLTHKPLPPFRKDCANPVSVPSMEIVYPRQDAKIFIPRDLDGERGSAVFEAAHRTSSATVFWHLDGTYVGSTHRQHHLALAPGQGRHLLTLVDEFGESLDRTFTVISNQ